jgi:hypothetical protein
MISIPADNGGFLLNRKTTKNVDCPFFDSGDNIGRIFSGVPNEYFESDGLTQPLRINMTFTEAHHFLGFGIINHNIPEIVTSIKVRFSSTGFEEEDIEVEDALAWHEKNIYKFIDRQYQYCQLEIDCDGYSIRIGELFPAREVFQFPCNYNWGYEREFNVAKFVTTSDTGTHFEEPNIEQGDRQPAEYEKLYFSFGPTDTDNFELYKKLVRVGQKIYIPDLTSQVCYMGIVPNDKLKGKNQIDGTAFNLNFMEHSIVPHE